MRYLSLILFALVLISIQALIGGVRMVFSIPAYLLLALAGLSLVFVKSECAGPRRFYLLAAVSLAVWVIGRAACSPVEYLARADLYMTMAALLVYLLTFAYFTDAKSRVTIAIVLVACALAHAAVGAVQFKQNDNFMLIPGIMRPPAYAWRASGFYICPNHLAGLLEIAGLMGLSIACWGRCKISTRVLVGYAVLMCLIGLAITGSRGGYLSIVFGLGVFALLSLWVVFRLRRGSFWPMFLGIVSGMGLIVGGAIFLMLTSDTLAQRLGQVYDPTNMRPLMWQAALKQYHLQPLTGTGSGTYLYFGRQFRSPLVQNDPMHVHCDYLELLAEYGLIGAVLGGIFLAAHLFGGLAGLKQIVDGKLRPGEPASSYELALQVGALSGIAALLAHSVLDFNLHIPANTLIVSFLFGILATRDLPANDNHHPSRRGWLRGPVLIVSLLLFGMAARRLPGEYFAEKARVALRDDRNAEALAFAEHGLAWEKKNPNLYAYVGEAKHFLTLQAPNTSSRRALHEEAVAAYQEALKLFPRDVGLLLKLGQTLDLLERFADAETVYQQAIACDPNFGNVYAYYGRHWQMQRRLQTAERYYRKALDLGATEIAPAGLEYIERIKKSPTGQLLMSLFPDVESPPQGVPPP